MIWFIYFPLILILMIICWLTNWIVVLFADDNGEINNKFLHLWQTWDDSLDSEFFMTEIVPRKYPFLDYHWKDKYISYQDTNTLKKCGQIIQRTCMKHSLTLKEKIQRYCCRVLWLMRNPAYGWSFYILGINSTKDKYHFAKNIDTKDEEFIFVYDKSKNILVRPWTLRLYKQIYKNFYITAYLGWKLPWWNEHNHLRSMIAYRIVPRFKGRE